MSKIMKKTQRPSTKLLLVATISSIFMSPSMATADTINYGNLGIKLVPFTIKEKTSVYQLATKSNLTIEQLNNLNRNQIRGRNHVSPGETIFVPSDSLLVNAAGLTPPKARLNTQTEIGATPAPIAVLKNAGVIEEPKTPENKTAEALVTETAQNSGEQSEYSSITNMSVDELIGESTAQSVPEPKAPEAKIDEPAPAKKVAEATQLQANKPVPAMVPQATSQKSAQPMEQSNLATEPTLALTPPASVTMTSETTSVVEPTGTMLVTPTSISTNTTQSTTPALPNLASQPTEIVPIEPTPMALSEPRTNNSSGTSTKAAGQSVGQMLSNNLESSLNRFGTAQVSVDVDEEFNFNALNFNVLGNLYETQNGLIFAQVGVNAQGEGVENRTVGNVGLGYRHDFDGFRAGANAFVDQDFSNNNTRMSVGGELAANYLNLSTNFYAPLSGWKQSDIIDTRTGQSLKERAAKGYDINANAYLPQHPQLGGGISFEQFFGDEVGLFSENEKQRNPSALAASIHYTPIPLVTAKAEHRLGNSGKNDTSLNLDVNLQLGRPLAEQLDPSKVAELRTLKGSKYDIVNRNYAIVYEYQADSGRVVIAGPATAQVNEVIKVDALVDNAMMPRDYTWHVTTPTAKEEFSGSVLSLPIKQEGQYSIQLAVTTENNEVKLSNKIEVDTQYQTSNEAVLSFEKANALASLDLAMTPFVTAVDMNQRLILDLDLPKAAANKSTDSVKPRLAWKTASGSQCADWCELNNQANSPLKYEVIQTKEGDWDVHVVGSESVLGEPIVFKSSITVAGVEYLAMTSETGEFN